MSRSPLEGVGGEAATAAGEEAELFSTPVAKGLMAAPGAGEGVPTGEKGGEEATSVAARGTREAGAARGGASGERPKEGPNDAARGAARESSVAACGAAGAGALAVGRMPVPAPEDAATEAKGEPAGEKTDWEPIGASSVLVKSSRNS